MPDPKSSSVPQAGPSSRKPPGERPPEGDKPLQPKPAPDPSHANEDIMGGLLRPGIVNVKMIYTSYLVAPALPIAALFGGFFAYKGLGKSPPAWLMTHYRYQMRTFWIGLGANLVAWALSFAGIGLLLFPLIAMWVVVRCVNGLIRVAKHDPIEHPESYLI